VSALPPGHPLLLLTPRELRRVPNAALVRVTVPALFLVEPVLRAARDAGAVVILTKPGAVQGQGPSPGQFAAAVVEAADVLGFGLPLALATAPLPLPGAGGGEHLRAEVQRYLDAGFTEAVLQAPRGPDAGSAFDADALRVALADVSERELPVSLHAVDAASARAALRALEEGGLAMEAVALETDAELGATELPGLELPLALARADARAVDVSAPLYALAARSLGARLAPERARELEEVDRDARLKLEALTYAEALGLLRRPLLRGGATRAMQALTADRVP